MQQWLSRHRTWGNKGQWSPRNIKQIKCALITSLLPGQSFQSAVQGESTQPQPECLSELRWQSWEYKVAKIFRAKYQNGESCSERELWRASEHPEYSVEYWRAHECEEGTRSHRKNHTKGLKWAKFRAAAEQGTVLVSTSQKWKTS